MLICMGYSRNWMSMAHGCASQSISIVTAYDSLGPEGVRHTLVQSDISGMYVDPQLFSTVSGAIKDAPGVKFLVYNDLTFFDKGDGSELEQLKKEHPDLKILSVSELRELGQKNPTDVVPPKPEDLFCLMYTSGTGGDPKGVPMSHEAIVAAGEFFSPNPSRISTAHYGNPLLTNKPRAQSPVFFPASTILSARRTPSWRTSPRLTSSSSLWRTSS